MPERRNPAAARRRPQRNAFRDVEPNLDRHRQRDEEQADETELRQRHLPARDGPRLPSRLGAKRSVGQQHLKREGHQPEPVQQRPEHSLWPDRQQDVVVGNLELLVREAGGELRCQQHQPARDQPTRLPDILHHYCPVKVFMTTVSAR